MILLPLHTEHGRRFLLQTLRMSTPKHAPIHLSGSFTFPAIGSLVQIRSGWGLLSLREKRESKRYTSRTSSWSLMEEKSEITTKRGTNEYFFQLLFIFGLKMNLVVDVFPVAIPNVLPLLLLPHVLVVLRDFSNYASCTMRSTTLLLQNLLRGEVTHGSQSVNQLLVLSLYA